MTNPNEIAEVIGGGQVLRNWTSVEVQRAFGTGQDGVVSYAKVEIAEYSDKSDGWGSIKLKPGDPATVKLAGKLSVTGKVAVRQVAYDARSHGCSILIESMVAPIVDTSVKATESKNKNYQALVQKYAKEAKVNVIFKNLGDAASEIFKRVQTHYGETPMAIISRLSNMRNVLLMDDAKGNLVAFRPQQGGGGGGGAALTEGKNILSARCYMDMRGQVQTIESSSNRPGDDKENGDKARAQAARAKSSTPNNGGTSYVQPPMPDSKKGVAMFVNQEKYLNELTSFNITATVQGWLKPGGSLWIEDVGQKMSIHSPMLIPGDGRASLFVQKVCHRQDNSTGTVTIIDLVKDLNAGSAGTVSGPQGSPNQKANPLPDDKSYGMAPQPSDV